MTRIVILFVVATFFASCNKEDAANAHDPYAAGSTDELNVPANFDWRTSRLVSFDISDVLENSDEIKTVSILNEAGDLLMTRRMRIADGEQVHLSLPLSSGDITILVDGQVHEVSLTGNGPIFKKGGGKGKGKGKGGDGGSDNSSPSTDTCPCEGRMENLTLQYSGPNGATLSVYWKAPGNNLASSHTFANLTTGQVISINGFDQNGNPNKPARLKSQTYLSIDGGANYWNVHTSCSEDILGNIYGPFEVIGFTDGQGRVCTSVIPCVDSDGDGCCDDVDAFPNDPSRCDVLYNPGKDVFASFAYEDLWPSTGDFDFNDMVVNRNTALYLDANGEVIEAEHTFELMAAGAGRHNGFGFSMPNFTPADISSVTSSYATPQNYHTVDGKGLETGQTKAVVILYENWRDIITLTQNRQFFNTSHSGGLGTSFPITVQVKFSAGQDPADALEIDPFLIINGANWGRSREIHLPWYGPTDLMDVSFFNTRNDASAYPNAGNNFVTANNIPWAIETPAGAFEWPIEKRDIRTVYFDFANWASTGSPADWYSNGNRDASQVY